jgi:hypothetical protein
MYPWTSGPIVNSFNDVLKDPWLAMLPATYQLLRLVAKKASIGGGAEVVAQYDFGSSPGTVAGGAASLQLCPVVILIPTMGIKTAGKIFLPAIAESQIAANAPNATWLTNLDTLMQDMMTGISFSSITWDLVIYSRKNVSFGEVLDYSTSPIVGFQRKRQRASM